MISTPTLPFVFSFIKDHLRHTMYVKYKGLLSFKEHKDSVYTSSSLKKYMHVNINTHWHFSNLATFQFLYVQLYWINAYFTCV